MKTLILVIGLLLVPTFSEAQTKEDLYVLFSYIESAPVGVFDVKLLGDPRRRSFYIAFVQGDERFVLMNNWNPKERGLVVRVEYAGDGYPKTSAIDADHDGVAELGPQSCYRDALTALRTYFKNYNTRRR